MVCFVPNSIMNNCESSDIRKTDSNEEDFVEIDVSDDDSDDTLKLTRIAGGSIVEYPPLYSPNADLIFTICKNVIQIYSTSTGQLLRNLDGSKYSIIGLEYEIGNNKILVACTERGEVIRWKWESGSLESKFQLMPKQYKIHTFNLLAISSMDRCAFVTFTKSNSQSICWSIVNINTGQNFNCPLKINLTLDKVFVATETKYFHYFVIIQAEKMYVINYRNWKLIWWINAQRIPLTCVKCHPTEEMIATGDALGRIFLWREFWRRQEPQTTLYHWHHTQVTSISFTDTGSGFYSSGLEAVLVKWNIDKPHLKNFLPRMAASIRHIVVSNQNISIAVATADNGIQILDDQRNANCVLQNFTHILDDKTGLRKFPVGLKLNPQSNCLILNGRTGHLQFFSTYTKSLLYNMDVVIHNRLSMESQKILYNIQVTKAAFNIDWMVTGEVWNDQEHLSELRLKFWEYRKENQSYCLNTNVELPHEGGFKALEFSDPYQSDNLLCVSVGNDNVIKIWSLGDSDNIYKQGKIWYCTGRTDFKNMPIESVSFSHDGSLLAAGFGNCLCVYKSENLKIKAVLTATNGNDGVVKKLQMRIPRRDELKQKKESKKNLKAEKENEKQRKLLGQLANLIENNELELITEVKKSQRISNEEINLRQFIEMKSSKRISDSVLFKRILSLAELNLFQKLCLYEKLEIFCSVPKEMQNRIFNYIASTISNAQHTEKNFNKRIYNIGLREKFKAKYKLYKYFNRQKSIDDAVKSKLIPLVELLSLRSNSKQNSQKIDDSKNVAKLNGFSDQNRIVAEDDISSQNILHSDFPIQSVSTIKRVLFATADFAHLIVVCTEHRVLIWNILTLKLQCVLKLSVREITVDPITSLFAIFTTNNELYVFLPNAPMPLYHRTNLPKIEGACWVPRKYPKSQSINLDWQSTSTLYFLTEKQELMYLSTDNDADNLAINFAQLNSEVQQSVQYTALGAYAIKQINSTKSKNISTSSSKIGIPGKYTIKSLINMPTHAMAPANLLCHTFTKSLIGIEESNKSKSSHQEILEKNLENDDDDSDDEIFKGKGKHRSMLGSKSMSKTDVSVRIKQDQKLRKVFDESVNILF